MRFIGRFRRAAIALSGRSVGLWSSGTNGSTWFGFFICDRGKSWFGEPEVRGTNFWELVEYYAGPFDRFCAG
jgi:hypothetical protein